MNVAPTSFIPFYCTVGTVHCTVHCTVYTVQYVLYTVQCTVYTVYHNKINPMMLEKDNEERRPAAYFLFGKFVK